MGVFERLLGKKEVVTTFDMKLYGDTSRLLEAAGIKFHTKITHTGSQNRSYGRAGSFGERTDCGIQYQIFVKKEEFERAQFALRRPRG